MRFLSVAEAAVELRLSAQTVYVLCKRRKIRHERHGLGRGKILIPADALDEYRRRVTVEAGQLSAPPPNPKFSPASFKHLRV
jgi:excisionase family DNA binding protein